MQPINLRQFAQHSVILSYNPETGAHEEHAAKNTRTFKESLTPGFYTRIGKSVYGVYPSSKGPCFFANKKHFLLADGEIEAEFKPASKSNTFSLLKHGKSVFEIDYPRVSPSEYGFDNWTQDEADADFFMWLYNSMTKKRSYFYNYYTQPEKTMVHAYRSAKSPVAAKQAQTGRTYSARRTSKPQSRR